MKTFKKLLTLLWISLSLFAVSEDYADLRLKKISIQGNEIYKESYLKRQIDIKPALTSKAMEKISEDFIKLQVKKLQAYYRSEGFLNCSVTDSLSVVNEKYLYLYFNVQENERYYINQASYDLDLEKIYIKGNNTFTERHLKRYIDIKPAKNRRSMARISTRYIKSQARNLKNYYVSEGFLNCDVKDSLVIVDKKDLLLFFNVKENERYFIKQISIEGNTLLSDGEILELLGVKIDKPFRQYVYYNNFKKILTRYSELGHPYAGIREEYDWGTDLEIALFIDEDLEYKVNNIIVSGNKSVYEPYIRKHFIIKEGKTYNLDNISRTQDRIYEMGAFSSVNITPVNPDSSEEKLDLKVSLIESKLRRFDVQFGGRQGYTDKISYSSLFLEPEWTHKNLFHRAHRLKAGFSYDALFHYNNIDHMISGELGYTVPWLFFLRLPTTFKVYYDRSVYNPFEEIVDEEDSLQEGEIRTDYGVNMSSIWRYNRNIYTRFSISLRNVKSELSDISTGFEPQTEISFQSRYDNRDSFIYPSKGWNILAYAGYVLGTETGYFRLESSVNAYASLTQRTVLAGRLEVGQFFEMKSIAATSLYQLGSESTVRGWSKSIGNPYPVDSDTLYAGKAKVLANIELRQDLFWNIGVNLFVDAGRLEDDLSHSLDWGGYFVNTGLGLYYRTPIGPIRVEFPFILNDPREDARQFYYSRISFGVLFAF